MSSSVYMFSLEVDKLVDLLREVSGYKTSGLEVEIHGLVAHLYNIITYEPYDKLSS
jgi:hypothetical protein